METLLTAIVLWLTANFELAASHEHPRIEFASTSTMRTLHYRNFLVGTRSAAGAANENTPPSASLNDLVAVYDSTAKTIYLPIGWTGSTPAELSILVHEMVHHLQYTSGLKYECPQAREKVAFFAQERWLRMFDSDLQKEFGIDPFSLLVLTNCGY